MHKDHELFTDKYNTILIFLFLTLGLETLERVLVPPDHGIVTVILSFCTLESNNISYVVLHKKCMVGYGQLTKVLE